MEFTIIKLSLANAKKLFVVSVYATNDNRVLFIEELESLFEKLKVHLGGVHYVIAGDLNARSKTWGDRGHNQRGKLLVRWEAKQHIRYKLKILPPKHATFKPAHTFLDLGLVDYRLNISNCVNGKTRTLAYDSDHSAITFSIDLRIVNLKLKNLSEVPHKLNFKSTSWKKFAKKLDESRELNIQDTRNLSIEEVDEGLNILSEAIASTIKSTVPVCKATDSLSKFNSSKIIKMQKNKSSLVSLLHSLRITDPCSRSQLTRDAEAALKAIRSALYREVSKKTDKFWTNQIKLIDHRKTDLFFPKINKLLRPKQFSDLENMHINQANQALLQRSTCDIANVAIEKGSYVFTSTPDKLNILSAFYESINSPRYLNIGTRLKNLVDKTANGLKDEFIASRRNGATIATLSENNRASNPRPDENGIHSFCNTNSVIKIFKKLPNKTSHGLDNIPSIILKHFTFKYIQAYTILFNNAINNHYFPKIWKKAKVLPILKKNKNPNDPSS